MRELFREFAADRMRSRDENRRDATLAWLVGLRNAQTKTKKGLPTLQSVLDGIDGVKRRQTVKEMAAVVNVLRQQFAGLPKRKKGR